MENTCLSPKCKELFYAQCVHGVIATVFDPQVGARVHDGVEHVQRVLAGDEHNVAQLTRKGQVHAQDVWSTRYVEMSVGVIQKISNRLA